jgi:hypothetical protein
MLAYKSQHGFSATSFPVFIVSPAILVWLLMLNAQEFCTCCALCRRMSSLPPPISFSYFHQMSLFRLSVFTVIWNCNQLHLFLSISWFFYSKHLWTPNIFLCCLFKIKNASSKITENALFVLFCSLISFKYSNYLLNSYGSSLFSSPFPCLLLSSSV